MTQDRVRLSISWSGSQKERWEVEVDNIKCNVMEKRTKRRVGECVNRMGWNVDVDEMSRRKDGRREGESIFFFYHRKERGKESWMEH